MLNIIGKKITCTNTKTLLTQTNPSGYPTQPSYNYYQSYHNTGNNTNPYTYEDHATLNTAYNRQDINMYQYNGANSALSHQQQSMAASSGAQARIYNRYNPMNTTTSINQHQNCQINGCATGTNSNMPSGTILPACCSNLYNDRGVTRSPVNFREGRRSSDGLMVAQQGIVAFQQKLYHKEKVKFHHKKEKI